MHKLSENEEFFFKIIPFFSEFSNLTQWNIVQSEVGKPVSGSRLKRLCFSNELQGSSLVLDILFGWFDSMQILQFTCEHYYWYDETNAIESMLCLLIESIVIELEFFSLKK